MGFDSGWQEKLLQLEAVGSSGLPEVRSPMTNAERQRRYRERRKAANPPKKSKADAARGRGVSRSTLHRYESIEKYPDLVESCSAGNLSLSEAYRLAKYRDRIGFEVPQTGKQSTPVGLAELKESILNQPPTPEPEEATKQPQHNAEAMKTLADTKQILHLLKT